MNQDDPALQAILRLPTEDRMMAARAILESLDQADDAPLSAEMIELLKDRLEDMRMNPETGEEWETVRASLEAGL